ncbi:hypothetical protein B0H12DRAFT_680943 [Mycena haematopus]|nr:hypothetical protein B0H12DRAFT_680943 [Mycena haematopus]
MRSYNVLPLDDDILDQIMAFCPTFATLQALILVSKAFHRVFQAHPKSITRAVAYNIVGPALPQALRAIRYPYDGYSTAKDPSGMATACPEGHNGTIITAAEQGILEENARVVGKLEDIYSLLNKDRTSQTSLLTAEESQRFRRAMYRLMLFSNIFPGNRYSADDFDELPNDDIFFHTIRAQRTAILNEYPTGELQELSSASNFLLDIFDDVANSRNHAFLSTGPSGALRAWAARSYDGLEDDIDFNFLDDVDDVPLYDGYLSVPLNNIWTARKITLPKADDSDEEEDGEPSSKWILDSVNGANDTCSQCSSLGGLDLYTEANWFRFLCHGSITIHLKAHLKHNHTLVKSLTIATAHFSAAPELSGPFIANLFMLYRTDKFDGWERTDSYCFHCLREFVEDHLWRWLLDERVKSKSIFFDYVGQPTRELTLSQTDGRHLRIAGAFSRNFSPPLTAIVFRYGWDCQTQPDLRHAETKNHLCDPIKGGNAVA